MTRPTLKILLIENALFLFKCWLVFVLFLLLAKVDRLEKHVEALESNSACQENP